MQTVISERQFIRAMTDYGALRAAVEMRQAAAFIRVNQNTFRHFVTTMADRIPVGELKKSNRRYFAAADLHEIQRVLVEEGKIRREQYPRCQSASNIDPSCARGIGCGS